MSNEVGGCRKNMVCIPVAVNVFAFYPEFLASAVVLLPEVAVLKSTSKLYAKEILYVFIFSCYMYFAFPYQVSHICFHSWYINEILMESSVTYNKVEFIIRWKTDKRSHHFPFPFSARGDMTCMYK